MTLIKNEISQVHNLVQDHTSKLIQKFDEVIKERIIKHGFDANDKELLASIGEIRQIAGDNFKHLYINNERIISWKYPEFKIEDLINPIGAIYMAEIQYY